MKLYVDSKYKRLIALTVWGLLSSSCSNPELSVEETFWNCRKENSIRKCDVEFKLKNSSHLPLTATVLIRAHHRGHIGDAMTNEVVAEKKLSFVIDPGESKGYQETLESVVRVTQIVVTASGENL